MWPAAYSIVFNCWGLCRSLKEQKKITFHILLHLYRVTDNSSYCRLLNISLDIFSPRNGAKKLYVHAPEQQSFDSKIFNAIANF